MKTIHRDTTGHIPIRIDPVFIDRTVREYSLKPAYRYTEQWIRAEWRGGYRNTTYAMYVIERGPQGFGVRTKDISRGARTLREVINDASEYFAKS